MKKFVKVLGLMALVLCFGVALVACGDDAEGTYEYKNGDNVVGSMVLEDGKFTMNMGEQKIGEGTYKVDGDKITFTAQGQSITGTLKDGKITVNFDGHETVYVKK